MMYGKKSVFVNDKKIYVQNDDHDKVTNIISELLCYFPVWENNKHLCYFEILGTIALIRAMIQMMNHRIHSPPRRQCTQRGHSIAIKRQMLQLKQNWNRR